MNSELTKALMETLGKELFTIEQIQEATNETSDYAIKVWASWESLVFSHEGTAYVFNREPSENIDTNNIADIIFMLTASDLTLESKGIKEQVYNDRAALKVISPEDERAKEAFDFLQVMERGLQEACSMTKEGLASSLAAQDEYQTLVNQGVSKEEAHATASANMKVVH